LHPQGNKLLRCLQRGVAQGMGFPVRLASSLDGPCTLRFSLLTSSFNYYILAHLVGLRRS